MGSTPREPASGFDLRRAMFRRQSDVEATLESVGPEVAVRHTVRLRDVSAGGARIESPAALPLGSRWRMRLDSAEHGSQEALVVVRWSSSTDGENAAGVQFIADAPLLIAAGMSADEIQADAAALSQGNSADWAKQFNIVATDDLHVSSLAAASVSAARNLAVDASLVNCTLDVRGGLNAPEGLLTGGSAYVMRRVVVAELGSADGRRTTLVLGRSARTHLLLEALGPALQCLRDEIQTRSQTVERLRVAPSDQLSHGDREQLTSEMFKVQELSARLERMQANGRKLRGSGQRAADVRLDVSRRIHPGVVLVAGQCRAVFTQPVMGPLIVTLNEAGDLETRPASEGAEPIPIAGVADCRREAA